MDALTIGLVQGYWAQSQDATKALYRDLVDDAVGQGATLICLPEFTLAPYFPAKTEFDESGYQWAEPLQGGISDSFFSELAKTYNVTVIGSLFEKSDDEYFDTATIHTPNVGLKYFTRKIHIPDSEGYHEADYFKGSDEFPVHDIGVAQVAVPTCYDQWFPELARIVALNGAEMIIYPSAIGSEPTAPDFNSRDAWQTVMRGHAVANGAFVAGINRVGVEHGVAFYGSSFVSDPVGNILAEASDFKEGIVIAELDPAIQMEYRKLFPLMQQRRPDLYGRLTDNDA